MEDFTRSMYANEKDLYKAKAEYFEEQLRFLVDEMYFLFEKEFRIDEDTKEEDFFEELMDAVEEKRHEKKLKIEKANELEKLSDVPDRVKYYNPPF